MLQLKKLARPASLLLALGVAMLTVGTVAHATQTIITPNCTTIPYSLSSGANYVGFTPASNQAVLVMGVQTASGYRGVGQVTMLHVPGQFLEWVGLESPTPSAITSGYSGTTGTHILYLDYSHTVDLQVSTADTFRIHNANPGLMTGSITMIW